MIVGRAWRARLMTAVVASATVYVPSAIAQSGPSNAELADLVKQQAEQIKRLNERIDELEGSKDKQARAESQQQNKARQPSQERAGDMEGAQGQQTKQAQTEPYGQDQARQPQRTAQNQGKTDTAVNQETVQAAQDKSQEKQDLEDRVAQLEDDRVKVDWSEGAPEFSSPDGSHTFRVGGRMQYDFSSTFGSRYTGDNGQGDRNITGTEFRRVRLGAQGKLLDPVLYYIEADFAGSDVSLTYAYLAFQHEFDDLGTGTLYFGNQYTDRAMDDRTSSKWTWFTEKNVISSVLTPGSAYDLGVTGEFVGEDDWHASLGVYKGSASSSKHTKSDDLTVISRAHWDPLVQADDKLLHVGVHGGYERFHDRDTPFTANSNVGTHYNSSLKINSDAVMDPQQSYSYGVELAGLYGPFAFLGEWGQRQVESHRDPKMTMTGYSGQVGYSLTGEAFGYDREMGVFKAPEVDNSVFKGGLGAWQLVARYQSLDIENSDFYKGGSGHGTTVGLNWYLNDLVRTMFEYTRWHTNNNGKAMDKDLAPLKYVGADDGNTVQGRIQFVF